MIYLFKIKILLALIVYAFCSFFTDNVLADTFGSGADQFQIEFLDIGSPNNPDNMTFASLAVGKVEYTYRMGKYEISEDMINKANALGDLGITHTNRGANKPATDVSWWEAVTFINWLNEQKGVSPAYKFNDGIFEFWQEDDPGYDPANPLRNTKSHYFLPNSDEWVKAAYYDDESDAYYSYPTGSDSAPIAVAFGTAENTAIYDQSFIQGPADIMLAGGASPFGTLGQGGNVWEWEENEFNIIPGDPPSRGVRGGAFNNIMPNNLLFLSRLSIFADNENNLTGFRVAAIIPEPSSLVLMLLAGLGIYIKRGGL